MAIKLLKRLLALDIGTKRIGVAISDPLNIFSTGLETISRMPETKAIETITKLCNQYNVDKIILGLPINMNGTEGEQVKDVYKFAETIKTAINIDIIYQDERLSSILAQRILIEQNISPSRNRAKVDKKAAELILQQYIDTISNRKEL